jgi:hypothetical protein
MKSARPLTLFGILLLLIAAPLLVEAGGPLGAVGTAPRRYPSTSMPITYKTDRNGLGTFSNTTATAIAVYAFTQWDDVLSAALSFTNGGQLARDVTTATDSYISGTGQFSDGVNPIVFDSSGAITDSRLGAGAKSQVLGFAGSAWNGTNLVEGYAIINGYLSGSAGTSDQEKYKATLTHEVGHFLGLHHAQIAMHGDYATMYPQIIKNSEQMTLAPDDTTAIANLYPTTAYTASVGSISGTVRSPSGANLSGINVVAEDSVTGACYSTLVDYYSGDDNTSFASQPAASGAYTIAGLPPGRYFIRIEPINSNFSGGSAVGSYRTPANTSVAREWYNGASESGDMLLDNTNQKSGVVVTAGTAVTGINLVSNESATLGSISYHNGVPSVAFALPGGAGSVITAYATKFTAPSAGSLLGIKLKLENNSSLPLNGTMTFTVHANATGSLAGIPGTVLGSVTIPFSDLASDQLNEIWLRGLGAAVNFTTGTDFHISITSNGVGMPVLLSDNGNPTANRSSYYTSASGWRNFPQGFATGTPGYNLIVSAVYSSSVAGNPQPAIALSPTSVDFGRARPGVNVDRSITLSNTGTATLNVTNTPIVGPDSLDYSITAGGGAFSLAAGASRTITVRFSPRSGGGASEAGTKSATLTITSNAATSPNMIPLVGYGVMPAANRLVTAIQFGGRRTGGSFTLATAIIRNAGNDTLHITGTALSGPDASAFRILSTTGALILPPDSVYTVQLQFLPTARRTYSATLTVTHDDAVGTTTVTVGGTGIAPVVAVADSLVFGNVRLGASAVSTVTVRNVGDAPLIISALTISGIDAAAFQIVSPITFPQTVAAGDSLAVQMRYTPSVRRVDIAMLTITSDAQPTANTVLLTGRGIAPVLTVATAHDAGSTAVGATGSTALLIRNTGDAPMVISRLNITGTNGAEFGTGSVTVPITIAPGASYTLPISFTPTARGLRTATLEIDSDDPNSARLTVQLAGIGLQGELVTTLGGADFGDVVVGDNAERFLVFRNSGTAAVTISSVEIAGAGFSLLAPPAPGTVVAVGDSITIHVLFSPAAQGPYTGTLTIRSDLPTPLTIALGGRGVLPGLATSRTLLAFGDVSTGQAKLDSFVIRNTGTSPLNGVTLALSGANAGAFEIVRPTGTLSIAAGDSAVVVVRLKSQSVTGALAATITVQASGGLSSVIALTGNVVQSNISVVRQVDFGTRPAAQTIDSVLTITNSGTAPLVISSVDIIAAKDGAPGSYFAATATTPQTILPGASTSLVIRFAPVGSGDYTGVATLNTDMPGTPTIAIELHGRVEATTGVEDRTVVTGGVSLTLLPIAPNPARDAIDIRMRVAGSGSTRATLKLVDLRGSVVETLYDGAIGGSGSAREFAIHHPLGSIPAGEYQLVLSAGGRVTSARVVVVR